MFGKLVQFLSSSQHSGQWLNGVQVAGGKEGRREGRREGGKEGGKEGGRAGGGILSCWDLRRNVLGVWEGGTLSGKRCKRLSEL